MGKGIKFTLVCVAAALLLSGSNLLAAGNVGDKAPALIVGDWVSQTQPGFTDLTGRVCIVEFWATWCGPCVKNIPHMNELTRKYAPQGVYVLGLSADKNASMVRDFVKSRDIEYMIAIDKGTSNAFAVTGYPTLFVTDAKGLIVWKGYPWTPGLEAAVEKALNEWPEGLDDVNFGPLKDLEPKLYQSRDFEKTYRELELCTADAKDYKAGIATKILAAINNAISKKAKLARNVESKDPKTASKMYAAMIQRYGDIAPTASIREELKRLAENEGK